MKKFLITMSAVVLFVFGMQAFADMKVGVLDWNKVMTDTPQVEVARKVLKEKFEKRDKEMLAAQKAFQADIEAFNKNGPTMKADDQKAAQQKIINKQKELQDKQAKLQKDLSDEHNKVMKDIMSKVEGVVSKVAADKKLDLVITKQATLYSKSELDVTSEVIKQMKK
ncbi:MAG: OmpH family outer membrane protein [bacterium]